MPIFRRRCKSKVALAHLKAPNKGLIFAVKNDLFWWVLGSVRTHLHESKLIWCFFVPVFKDIYYCYYNEDGFDWLCVEQSSTNKHETTCNNTQWHNALGTGAQRSGDFGELARWQDFLKHPEKSWANTRNHITYTHTYQSVLISY